MAIGKHRSLLQTGRALLRRSRHLGDLLFVIRMVVMALVHMLVVGIELQREPAMRLAAASSLRDVRIIFADGLVFEHLQLRVHSTQFGLAALMERRGLKI